MTDDFKKACPVCGAWMVLQQDDKAVPKGIHKWVCGCGHEELPYDQRRQEGEP